MNCAEQAACVVELAGCFFAAAYQIAGVTLNSGLGIGQSLIPCELNGDPDGRHNGDRSDGNGDRNSRGTAHSLS